MSAGFAYNAQHARDALIAHGWVLVLDEDKEERWAKVRGGHAWVSVWPAGEPASGKPAALNLDARIQMPVPTIEALQSFLRVVE